MGETKEISDGLSLGEGGDGDSGPDTTDHGTTPRAPTSKGLVAGRTPKFGSARRGATRGRGGAGGAGGSDDPLLFDAAPYAVTWRNGEPGHGGRAYAVNASSLALVYEW